MKEPLLKSVMTPFPHSVQLDAPLGEARIFMLKHRVHHLPVMLQHELKGIITDRDIKLLLGPELGSPDPKTLTVEDAYIDNCFTVDLNTPLLLVLSHMAEKHHGATLITTQGRLAGIFTSTDACRVLANYLNNQFHTINDGPPDAA